MEHKSSPSELGLNKFELDLNLSSKSKRKYVKKSKPNKTTEKPDEINSKPVNQVIIVKFTF